MARVTVSGFARQDVRDHLSYLRQHACLAVARRYGEDFKAAYRRLADFPESGPPRPALGPDACIKIVPPYLLVYDYERGVVRVLRVVHGQRDISEKLVRR